MKSRAGAAAALVLAACNQTTNQQPSANTVAAGESRERSTADPAAGDTAECAHSAGRAQRPNRSQEPRGGWPGRAALWRADRRELLRRSCKLWGDARAAAAFAKALRPATHLEIGDLGETEGARGFHLHDDSRRIFTATPSAALRMSFFAASTTFPDRPPSSAAGTSNGSSGRPRARSCSAHYACCSRRRSSPAHRSRRSAARRSSYSTHRPKAQRSHRQTRESPPPR